MTGKIQIELAGGEQTSMLQAFLSLLKSNASNDRAGSVSTRRRFPRRETDQCIVVVCGQAFPVEDWSQGGLLIQGDERLFSVGQDVDLTVKFKLRNIIIDVEHKGRVIRKGNSKIALEFDPLSRNIRRRFQQVLDDALAREFANSQV